MNKKLIENQMRGTHCIPLLPVSSKYIRCSNNLQCGVAKHKQNICITEYTVTSSNNLPLFEAFVYMQSHRKKTFMVRNIYIYI